MPDCIFFIAEKDLSASPVHYAELSSGLLKVASRFQIYSSAQIFRHETLPVKAKHGAVLLTQGGSGGAERAYETACLIFQSIGIKEIFACLEQKHRLSVCCEGWTGNQRYNETHRFAERI